jgi:hypothetical protein
MTSFPRTFSLVLDSSFLFHVVLRSKHGTGDAAQTARAREGLAVFAEQQRAR